jgi:3-hydroxyacyl-[acyl-carrier-protein] dehydratase
MMTKQVKVPLDSIWFDGHFPNDPILPGVAQLALVLDLLKETIGQPISATEVSRVRFKQAIRPDEEITIEVSPKAEPLSFGFRILSGTEQACSGNVRIQTIAKANP